MSYHRMPFDPPTSVSTRCLPGQSPAPDTELTIDRALNEPAPARGKAYLRCPKLRGFGVCVTASGARSYFVEARIRDGDVRRRVLGKVGQITMTKARAIARELIAEARLGKDIKQRKSKAVDAGTLTLESAWHKYRDRGGDRKIRPATLLLYRRCMVHFADWASRELWAITRADIANRFDEIQKKHGDVTASQTFRLLR